MYQNIKNKIVCIEDVSAQMSARSFSLSHSQHNKIHSINYNIRNILE